MAALEWFESILAEGGRIKKIRQEIAELDSRIGPRPQSYEPMGHGGGSADAILGMAMVSARIGELRRLLPVVERKHEAKLEYAMRVLYGRSGRGGVAKARSDTDADILFCHYLQGKNWASIAREFEPDTRNLTVWCKRKAVNACKFIDRVGMDALIDT